jgi:TPR repeat protein
MVALADVPAGYLQATGKAAPEWRRAAADLGNVRAAITLASASDDAEATRWIARAEALPVCAARDMADLAQAYRKAPGPKSDERANYWLQKAVSTAKAGEQDPTALFLIGRAMIEGGGGQANKQEAIGYIKQAADAGRTEAMRYLARGYVSGQIGETNTKAAIEWFTKSLRSGDVSAAADLSRLAAAGGGDGAAAIEALKQTSESGSAPAMREYGRVLQLGLGVPAEPEKGAVWLRKAAEAGDTGAMKELSRAYASGYGVELSARDSTEWLQRAAKAGDAEAMYSLSLALTVGFGTDVNAAAAQEWLKTAEGTARK